MDPVSKRSGASHNSSTGAGDTSIALAKANWSRVCSYWECQARNRARDHDQSENSGNTFKPHKENLFWSNNINTVTDMSISIIVGPRVTSNQLPAGDERLGCSVICFSCTGQLPKPGMTPQCEGLRVIEICISCFFPTQ